MRNILVVVESADSAKMMLEKSLRFLPESISVVLFSDSNAVAADVQTVLNDVAAGHCTANLIINSAFDKHAKKLSMTDLLSHTNPDMVVIYRPQLGQGQHDFGLVKAVLQSESQSAVLFCGDNKWKKKMKVLATLDMVDDSPSQGLLNDKVADTAVQLLNMTQAELTLLSVIEISGIREELDIAIPHELMATKGKEIKARLADMISTKGQPIVYSTFVSVGVVSKEISSVSQKLKSSLVIMGNVGRTGLKGFVVGNTAEKILERLAVDALIVKA
ncbi:universal stress protein [Aliiglaciecola litoralis]|uniref:UspA domain-containing protein n=1 Tax=Aliiglaciecola litoralis TaxID=582857 RepID=A0ABN1LRT0_9ALTE